MFSGITNIVSCIQKALNEDNFAGQKNVVLVPVKSDDTAKMLESAEIVVSGMSNHHSSPPLPLHSAPLSTLPTLLTTRTFSLSPILTATYLLQ